MRLFHVSEENDIEFFTPRIPKRVDLDKTKGLVWAITEECLSNFLTPRNCPRVTYHVGKNTTQEDIDKYFTNISSRHTVIIENKWVDNMKKTCLYLYEFETKDFYLQDEIAGYYVSYETQIPISKHKIDDLFSELFNRNVEVKIVDNLQNISKEIQKTSFNWSMCRMIYAQKTEDVSYV